MHLSCILPLTKDRKSANSDLVNQRVLNVGIFAKEEKLSISL